eukprot:5361477-Amphidinium_carterae.1
MASSCNVISSKSGGPSPMRSLCNYSFCRFLTLEALSAGSHGLQPSAHASASPRQLMSSKREPTRTAAKHVVTL